MIYHLAKQQAWQAAQQTGRYTGSEADRADGFLHFSTAEQIAESARKHRAGEADLVLLGVEEAPLGQTLVWEKSRGGALFPHVYGDVPLDAIRLAAPLPLGPTAPMYFRSCRAIMSLHDLMMPLVRCLDPEQAHRLTIAAMRRGLGPRMGRSTDDRLTVQAFGLTFPSPIGLAAGFDKDAEVVRGAFAMGFGFVEVGSITPLAQQGNPKPRLFRLAQDGAVINRMGFNNKGAAAAAARLHELRRKPLPGPLGVNFGKNKTSEDAAADYAACSAALSKYADYITINVSSPNTPGLRALQSPDQLRELVAAVRRSADPSDSLPPILVKIAPDLEEADLESIAEVAAEPDVGGLIVSNTTIARPETLKSPQATETGGLSGRPLFEPSTDMLRRVYRLTGGKVPLIGVGGVSSAADAYRKIRSGATLVQLYSALVYEGPGLVARITRDLPALLARDGFASVADAVGADCR